ncbi:MAG: phytanoyl-CoA dioxygenase family protein, partial [Planctomycetaceae bacterium]|nr:phytanoyl-CoA dioxygenase family protein [Planctomycetaceae bacterium]
MSQFSPHSLKHQFDSDGLTFIPSFRSQLEVGDNQNNLDRVIQNVVPTMPAEHVFYEDKQDRSSLKQLQNLHLHDDYFGQLMTDSPFRKLAETLLDSKVVCKNMQY